MAKSLMSRDYVNDPNASLSPEVRQALMRISKYGPYGYRPHEAGAIVFCIVFGILASVLTYQGIKKKRWWLLATLAFGSWCECIGNGIRIYGHFHPSVISPYIAQQCILVLTPAFFAAAHFTVLTKLCQLHGAKYIWPVRPSWLVPFFVILDVASLAIQGAGSGQAAVAEINNEPVAVINSKGNIVVGGLAIQLAGYVAFNALFILFIIRAIADKRKGEAQWFDARQKLFFIAVYVSALLVLGRSAFRTAEMGSGWVGMIATTEWYYLTFDATFVALAVLLLTVISPVRPCAAKASCSARRPSEGRAKAARIHDDLVPRESGRARARSLIFFELAERGPGATIFVLCHEMVALAFPCDFARGLPKIYVHGRIVPE